MTPDPKLRALGLTARRVAPDELLAEAERERAEEMARLRATWPHAARPGAGMIHPGFADTAGMVPALPSASDAAFQAAVFLFAFGAGAIVQAWGGWRSALAVGVACAVFAARAVRRARRP